MATINTLLDESIAADAFRVREHPDGDRRGTIDLSVIDFEALANRFAGAQRKNVKLEQLRRRFVLNWQMVRLNRTRADC